MRTCYEFRSFVGVGGDGDAGIAWERCAISKSREFELFILVRLLNKFTAGSNLCAFSIILASIPRNTTLKWNCVYFVFHLLLGNKFEMGEAKNRITFFTVQQRQNIHINGLICVKSKPIISYLYYFCIKIVNAAAEHILRISHSALVTPTSNRLECAGLERMTTARMGRDNEFLFVLIESHSRHCVRVSCRFVFLLFV